MSRGPVFMVRQADPPGGRRLRRLVTGVVHRGPNGEILLERIGPFLPPITLPGIGVMVATTTARAAIEDAGLDPWVWRPVEKLHIPLLDWVPVRNDRRRLAAPVPDPEAFLVEAEHDPTAADALGDLWAVEVPSVDVGESFELDLFRITNRVWLFVSERCRQVLEAQAEGWLQFQSVMMR